MPQPLPRFVPRQIHDEDAAKLDRIIREAGDVEAERVTGAPGGDWERLRGLPAIGRGVRGAVAGSVPGRSLL